MTTSDHLNQPGHVVAGGWWWECGPSLAGARVERHPGGNTDADPARALEDEFPAWSVTCAERRLFAFRSRPLSWAQTRHGARPNVDARTPGDLRDELLAETDRDVAAALEELAWHLDERLIVRRPPDAAPSLRIVNSAQPSRTLTVIVADGHYAEAMGTAGTGEPVIIASATRPFTAAAAIARHLGLDMDEAVTI